MSVRPRTRRLSLSSSLAPSATGSPAAPQVDHCDRTARGAFTSGRDHHPRRGHSTALRRSQRALCGRLPPRHGLAVVEVGAAGARLSVWGGEEGGGGEAAARPRAMPMYVGVGGQGSWPPRGAVTAVTAVTPQVRPVTDEEPVTAGSVTGLARDGTGLPRPSAPPRLLPVPICHERQDAWLGSWRLVRRSSRAFRGALHPASVDTGLMERSV